MTLEIICITEEDIIQMNNLPKGFCIELCSDLDKDGLTPNINLVKKCVDLSIHPIRVMIRNHDNGFHYTKEEVDVMVNQIQDIKKICNPTGFVFGCLNKEGNAIDEIALEKLTNAAEGFSNTFHKAIEPIIDEDFYPILEIEYPNLKLP